MLKQIKKMFCFVMCILCIMSITGCKTKTGEEIKNEPVFDTGINGPIYLSFGEISDKRIQVNIPLPIGDYCHTTYSSSNDEKWAKLTIYAMDESHPMFTIYSSLDKSYENFENEKSYEILLQNDECTVIWYEYNNKTNNEDVYDEAIQNITNNFKAIKESTVILIEEEEGHEFNG